MTDFERLLKNLEKLIEETQDKLTDREDELRDEVIDNVRCILDNEMDCDSDLMEYINDNFDVEIHEMDEYEFNDYCSDHDIRPYEALDLDLSTSQTYFGRNRSGDLVSYDYLSDFIDLEDVAKELVSDDNDLGNSGIREELDRLKESDECREEFIKEVKKLLGIEKENKEENKEVNEATNT